MAIRVRLVSASIHQVAVTALCGNLKWRTVALICGGLICSCAAPALAHAAEYKIYSCSRAAVFGTAASAVNWIPSSTAGRTVAGGACPQGLTLSADSQLYQGQPGASWTFSMNVVAKRFKLTVGGSGEDGGYDYVAEVCGDTCATMALPTISQSFESERTVQLPFSGNSVRVKAVCAREVCEPTHVLSFHDLVATVDDLDPPFVGFGDRRPTYPLHRSLWWESWNPPDAVSVTANVADKASGIGSASVYLDGQEILRTPNCSVLGVQAPGAFNSVAGKCPARVEGAQIDGGDLSDGKHTVTFSAVDAAGNVLQTQTRSFSIDGTPPPVPEDVTVLGFFRQVGAWHWTSDGRVSVSWRNPETPSQTQSQIVRSWHELIPLDGQRPVDPAQGGTTKADLVIPEDGRWDYYVWMEDVVHNQGGKQKLRIGRDTDAPAPPILLQNPWMNRKSLATRHRQLLSQPEDPDLESGVCGYAVKVDGTADSDPAVRITDEGAVDSVEIPADLPEGEHFVHVRAISCAGLASTTTTTTPIRVDDTPPEIEFHLPPGGGWVTDKHVTVTATDKASGIETIKCSLDSLPLPESQSSELRLDLTSGKHSIDCRAADRAGNESLPERRLVSVDQIPPSGVFDLRDVADPTLVRARFDDAGSGLSYAQIEYRRLDVAGSWKLLVGGPVGGPNAMLEARLPDAFLPDGLYALRMRAGDVAGNEVVSDTSLGGMPMRVSLPLRDRPRVTAALARLVRQCRTNGGRPCSRTTSCSAERRPRCDWNTVLTPRLGRTRMLADPQDRVAVIGVLTDRSGTPLSGNVVKLYAGPPGDPEPLGETRTNGTGRYRFDLPRLPSSRIIVRSPAGPLSLGGEATADLGVRTPVTLSAAPRVLHGVGTVRFRARIIGSADGLEIIGKLVHLEYRTPFGWGTVKVNRADSNGRVMFVHTFSNAQPKAKSWKFRASVPHEPTWPYEDGHSRSVTVRQLP